MSTPHLPPTPAHPDLKAAEQALQRADWRAAADAFRAVLATSDSPDAREGLAFACYWQGEVQDALAAQESAYRLYQQQGERRGAARVATWLALEYAMGRGQTAVANGWLQRAHSLLADLPPSPELAWLLFWEAHLLLLYLCDPARARTQLSKALNLARQTGQREVEMMAGGLEGVMLVQEGSLTEGMRRLDEVSTAAVSGELSDRCAAGQACCYVLTTCEAVGDFERAAQWLARVKDRNEPLRLLPYDSYCRNHLIGILLSTGRWMEAEEEIGRMRREGEAMIPSLIPEAVSRLGELRRRQGRTREAEALFTEVDTHPRAMLGRAWILLEVGDARRALEMVERYFRLHPPGDRLARLPALEIKVEACAAVGDLAAAATALGELREIADRMDAPALRAMVHMAAGLTACAAGEHDDGRRSFEDAVAAFERLGAPYETARARRSLARCLAAVKRVAEARRETKKADEALRALGAISKRSEATPLTSRELDVIRLVAQGLSNKEIAAALRVSEHTVHRHIANVLTRLDLPSRSAAVAHAAKLGLLKS
jgi:LuxR family maltose regulon positive regulatory protein